MTTFNTNGYSDNTPSSGASTSGYYTFSDQTPAYVSGSSANGCYTYGAPKYTKISIPLVRQVYPQLISDTATSNPMFEVEYPACEIENKEWYEDLVIVVI